MLASLAAPVKLQARSRENIDAIRKAQSLLFEG